MSRSSRNRGPRGHRRWSSGACTGGPRPRRTLGSSPYAYIGDESPTNYEGFVGVIDEIRVWNIARTGAEITATMHQRLTGTETGLVGYLRCDEGSGSVASDSSPSGNDATLDAVSGVAAGWVVSDAPMN